MSLGTKMGNFLLTGFGACSSIVGACEALIGVLINNSGGNVDKAMERYYEHH